ncbi:polysaccharide deacetylase [Bacillus sp. HMF5848]|uniref:polysaccharide deacetylase family protein n=1 Tax=Bacillus sp. HMF5848 TaxID=2495421 RepID=UPI000F7AAF19|nr:polysaccharide deacetylase family protein [Bacillus sp. HMF5848]RSK27309.1 polysaccharide deacetylase [Bacillus sp. HMF5848]
MLALITHKRYLQIFIPLISITAIFFIVGLTISSLPIDVEKTNVPLTTVAKANEEVLFAATSSVDAQVKYTDKTTNNINTNSSNKKIVYLTFDDGPSAATADILTILKEYKAKATFFMLKNNIERYPTLAIQVVQSQNAAGCHGVTHRVNSFYKNKDTAVNEMLSCRRSLAVITAEHSNIIRTPFGSYPYMNEEIRDALSDAGFIYWDWNVDSSDWTATNAADIVKTVKQQINTLDKKGITPVILLHDEDMTAQALPEILQFLKSLDYKFAAIRESDPPLQFNVVEKSE